LLTSIASSKSQGNPDPGHADQLRNANVQDVVAAHIHCAAAGANGPVGVTLFSSPPAGAVQGTLVEGVITAPNPGNGCGWPDLASVVASMRSGDTYVNVHTLPPGVPSGEVRGQVK
jgi:hypothetical protein